MFEDLDVGKMYEKQLQRLGLTEGESKVYEAMLSLGPSTVGPLVKKSGVAYSNIYEILGRLQDKGFVSFVVKEKTKYFQAVEPVRIRDYLEKQESELQDSRKTFESLLPHLERLTRSVGEREETEVFIGEKGLRTAFDILLKGAVRGEKELFFYVHDPLYYERADSFYRRTWPSMQRLGIRADGISNEDYRNTGLSKESPKFIRQRYVPFPVPGNIDIFRDKVLITVWREKPVGILIHSREVAENFSAYFGSIWEMAKG
jgi:sugar-specific transcriptional regulator TrmB